MTIDILFETADTLPFAAEPLLEAVIREVLRQESCPFEVQICVSFVDDEEIRIRNRNFRQKDCATDVLSFPLVPFRNPADFRFLEEGEEEDCFDPDTDELCLGDIVISTDRARQQAAEYGLSNAVLFIGNVSNVHDYLQAMDVFVFPSRFEGLGIVGIEAQANGMPVIASTNVPKELQLSPLVKFCGLEDRQSWMNEIKESLCRGRTDVSEQLKLAGYDIGDTAQIVRELYCKLC